MRTSVHDAWLGFNKPLEGRVKFMYCDVKGLVSTGVGNLIDFTKKEMTPPTAAERAASLQEAHRFDWRHGLNTPEDPGDGSVASAAEVDAAWDAVKAKMDIASHGHLGYKSVTTLRISDAEIDRFVFVRLGEFEADLKRQPDFAKFDDWPADAQLALLSMAWGMGTRFGFPTFRAFAKSGDFEGCARECRFNPNVGTIVTRNDRDQLCFRNAAQVVAAGLDREKLIWPGTAPSVPTTPTPPPTTPTPPPTTPTPPPTTPTPPPTTPTPPPTTPTPAADHADPAADHADAAADHADPAADHADPAADHADPAADHADPAADHADPAADHADAAAHDTDPAAHDTDSYTKRTHPYAEPVSRRPRDSQRGHRRA